MLRRFFAILSALSMVLCVATVVLWIRSYRWGYSDNLGNGPREDNWSFASDPLLGGRPGYGNAIALSSFRGQIFVGYFIDDITQATPTPQLSYSDFTATPNLVTEALAGRTVLGVGAGFSGPEGANFFGTWLEFAAMAPHAGIAVTFAILPAGSLWTALRSRRLKRRKNHNLCPACGYDLRATPNRCPECGTAPAPPVG